MGPGNLGVEMASTLLRAVKEEEEKSDINS